jgi:hypothetical protein
VGFEDLSAVEVGGPHNGCAFEVLPWRAVSIIPVAVDESFSVGEDLGS